MNYIIGSGWWSPGSEIDNRQMLFGIDQIRSKAFHELWYQQICKYTSPTKILIVDSCSPILPNINKDDNRLELLRLSFNAGHSTNHKGKFCGYLRAILIGMYYALQCDVDYYVYIEQDALIHGEGIIEHCIEKMTTEYMFGDGYGTPYELQQSFFIIHKNGILPFIERINAINYPDNTISPEIKFHLACCHGPIEWLAHVSMKAQSNSFYKWLDWQLYKYTRNYDFLPIGYGRTRPINFDDPFFYFQHASADELNAYLSLTGFGSSLRDTKDQDSYA